MAVSLSTPRSDRPHSEMVVACAVSWQAGTNSRAPNMSPTLIKLMEGLVERHRVLVLVTCKQSQHMALRFSLCFPSPGGANGGDVVSPINGVLVVTSGHICTPSTEEIQADMPHRG
ncbi:hypothetical protein TOPH_00277 [Tolypocladium ophioglossoides CBS 100239]|uniref:Uncharacterized protein n=1 Tax=Tolypocladium ophioglossoides (strain CBS 100239) TaxID=1163406 RepID=A0A0L0NLE0_TOLOC|nr:hypothetical protein TOPH_00277 [Tolypocladium ophioglossoides CBS 100239]